MFVQVILSDRTVEGSAPKDADASVTPIFSSGLFPLALVLDNQRRRAQRRPDHTIAVVPPRLTEVDHCRIIATTVGFGKIETIPAKPGDLPVGKPLSYRSVRFGLCARTKAIKYECRDDTEHHSGWDSD